MALAVLVIVAVGCSGSEGGGDGRSASARAGTSRLAGEWSALPTTRLSGYSLRSTYLFWTGDSLITIDTSSGGEQVQGEIYRPAEHSVRRIAESGLDGRANAAVTWTGQEVIVAEGSNGPGITPAAAAYDLATDTWRELAPPPGFQADGSGNQIAGPAVWSGTEMIAWRSGLALNPATNTWRTIAPPPIPIRADEAITMTPYGVFVWGGCRPTPAAPHCDEVLSGDELSDGAIYNPETDSWAALPIGPLGSGDHPTAVWTGTEVLRLTEVVYIRGLL
jgi:hypothetical protein